MSFEDLLKSLHEEYLASIPEKISVIEGQIKQGDAANLRESFHKLKGTGRTYGLPEVSDLAEVVEDICNVRPVNAVRAAGAAVGILRDIYSAHHQHHPYSFDSDPRLEGIRKLLQN
jgi:HPt (histidine-containing phosphotransfer) domain-containing protein